MAALIEETIHWKFKFPYKNTYRKKKMRIRIRMIRFGSNHSDSKDLIRIWIGFGLWFDSICDSIRFVIRFLIRFNFGSVLGWNFNHLELDLVWDSVFDLVIRLRFGWDLVWFDSVVIRFSCDSVWFDRFNSYSVVLWRGSIRFDPIRFFAVLRANLHPIQR